jgi:DNA polymerase-3 subunit delta
MPYVKQYEFLAELRSKKFKNVYLFAGEDVYTAESCLDQLLKALAIDPINIETYFAGDSDLNDVILSAQTMPFLADKKAVILKNSEKLRAADLKKLAEVLKLELPSIFIMMWPERVKSDTKSLSVFKAADETGVIVECRQLYDNEVPRWIQGMFSKEGRRVASDAVEYLIKENGSNLMNLSNEIEKLLLYTKDKKEIDVSDVELSSGHTKMLNLNNLQEAIEARSADKAIKIADSLISEGEIPLMIIGTIYRTVRRLLEAKTLIEEMDLSEQETAKALRMHPYFAKIFFTRAAGFNSRELKKAVKHTLEADRKIKSTTIPANIVVDELLMKVCAVRKVTSAY